jgi:hypothetical protein
MQEWAFVIALMNMDMLFLVKNSLIKKEVWDGEDATASWDQVFTRYHTVAVKRHSICGIDCSSFQDEFFVNNLLDVKENYDHALDLALHLSRLFSVPLRLDFKTTYGLCFLPRMRI